jgi:Arc/MetJ family transcription regulator
VTARTSKIVIDLDDDLLAEAAIELKTTLPSDTVAAALRRVIAEWRAQKQSGTDT